MQNVLLVAVDDDDGSRRAVDYAAERAKTTGASLHLVHVVPWSPYSFLTQEELAERHKHREDEVRRAEADIIKPIVDRLGQNKLKVASTVRHGNPAEVVCDVAKEAGAYQIVVGRKGRDKLTELLFGGLTAVLVQAAPVPVTVVP